jgi:lysophospholipase L1-like esterase
MSGLRRLAAAARVPGAAGGLATLDSSALVPSGNIPPSLRELGGPSYNVTPSAFPNWRAKLSNVRAAANGGASVSFAKVVAIGDSTAAGGMSTSPDVFTKSWPSEFASLMDKYYCPTQRSMTWGAGPVGVGVPDSRVTLGTGWNNTGGLSTLGNGGWVAATSATGQLTFTPGIPVDTFAVTYTSNTGLGSVVVKADAGATTLGTIATAGGSLTTLQTVYTITKGTHTFTLDPPTGNTVFIAAIEAYDSTLPSVRVAFGAKSGTKVADFNTNSLDWQSKSYLKADLALVSLTVNDAGVTSVGTYTASMTTLINNLKTNGTDVLLVVGPPRFDDTGNANMGPLVNALYGLCDSLNVGMVDTMARFGSYAVSSPFGYYDGASLHLSPFGYADMGQAVFNAIKTL